MASALPFAGTKARALKRPRRMARPRRRTLTRTCRRSSGAALEEKTLMMTLRDLPLRSVPVVTPEASLQDALDQMNDDPLRTVVLVGDGMFLGVLDEESLAGGIPSGMDLSTLAVGSYAHHARVLAAPGMTVDDALALLDLRSRDVLPVVRGVRYQGVVTREDLLARAGNAAGASNSDAETDITVGAL